MHNVYITDRIDSRERERHTHTLSINKNKTKQQQKKDRAVDEVAPNEWDSPECRRLNETDSVLNTILLIVIDQ